MNDTHSSLKPNDSDGNVALKTNIVLTMMCVTTLSDNDAEEEEEEGEEEEEEDKAADVHEPVIAQRIAKADRPLQRV